MYKGSEEKWRDIKEYEGLYQISNYGNVKSLSYRRMGICKELAKIKNSNGYISASLFKKGKGKQYRIHRLVAIAFIDNSINKPQVNHKDGNKQNNSVNNLEWATKSENEKHSVKNNLRIMPKSDYENNGNSKLTKKDVIEINLLINNNLKIKDIAWKYNVSYYAIWAIKKGITWKGIV